MVNRTKDFSYCFNFWAHQQHDIKCKLAFLKIHIHAVYIYCNISYLYSFDTIHSYRKRFHTTGIIDNKTEVKVKLAMFTNAKSELAKLLPAFYGTPFIKPSS